MECSSMTMTLKLSLPLVTDKNDTSQSIEDSLCCDLGTLLVVAFSPAVLACTTELLTAVVTLYQRIESSTVTSLGVLYSHLVG